MGVEFQLVVLDHPDHSPGLTQWFTFVFAFKETSSQPEVSRRRRSEKQSHYMVVHVGGGFLCHWNTKDHTQAKQRPSQRWW